MTMKLWSGKEQQQQFGEPMKTTKYGRPILMMILAISICPLIIYYCFKICLRPYCHWILSN